MRLILIRHAASQHSQQGIIADIHGCTGLTAIGVQQAQTLAKRLRQTRELDHCAALLTSPVLRARQTAELLKPVLAVADLIEDGNLCELLVGVADGMSNKAYRAQYGEFAGPLAPNQAFAAGGESWAEFMQRVQTTLDQLAKTYANQTIVAVSHAGFIVGSMLKLFDIPRPGTGTWLDPSNTGLTEWQCVQNTWRLIRYNDEFHLKNQHVF
ncbi:histidine phosphatase family protein [Herpetosiphon llansteffanensis]|uniref:histidine phosphatase family protein n=1 Tax=Herpetosiphon llansteffanensis TaxID=2094568 RepID=UPI000D7C9FBE|nr:histidine phosphatase family protein [Herpetosiphon llansteffanensis]